MDSTEHDVPAAQAPVFLQLQLQISALRMLVDSLIATHPDQPALEAEIRRRMDLNPDVQALIATGPAS